MILETDPRIQTLQNAHVVRLQSAARMAGLSWKSGTPGYDKAGIISRLRANEAMFSATVAAVLRMSNSTRPDVSFADDLADDMPAPVQAVQPSAGPDPELTRRVSRLEDFQITPAGMDKAIMQALDNSLTPVKRVFGQELQAQSARIAALSEKIEALRPVQFTVNGVTHAPVSGQHERFPRLVRWLGLRSQNDAGEIISRTHALLVGPAGTGKTTAAASFAKMCGLPLYAQPLTVDAFGVVGFTTATGEIIETEFSRAWVNGGVLLWDELSMSAADALGALNSALANGFIALPGKGNVRAHPDFYFIAGDNSDTGASALFSARTLLDGATLDRFVRLDWPVDLHLESNLSQGEAAWLNCVRAIREFIAERDIQHVGATSRAVIIGAQALKAGGFSRLEILEDTCRKGALVESWDQVTRLPAVVAFLRS